MENKSTTEQRLAALEREIAQLRRAVALNRPTNGTHWLDSVSGSMADFADFPEVVRLGREFRESQIINEPEGTV